MKSSVTITLETETLKKVRRTAVIEHRSLSQQISLLVERELGPALKADEEPIVPALTLPAATRRNRKELAAK